MDDLETTTTETSAPEAEGTETTSTDNNTESPPWGEDFNPERAWSTIQTQRQSETQLKQQLQELQQYRDVVEALQDPERQADVLGRLGLELEQDEEPDELDDDPPLTRREFEQWQQQQQQQSSNDDLATELAAHIDRLAKDNKLTLSDDEKEFLFFRAVKDQNQIGPDNTQAVFNEWAKAQKAAMDGRFNEYRDQKLNAPHVSTVGSQATDEVLPLDAPLSDVSKWAAERYAMGRQQ